MTILADFASQIVATLAAAVATFILMRYWNCSVGTRPRPDPSTPRVRNSLPFVGALVPMLANYHNILDWASDECENVKWKPAVILLPFTPTHYVFSDPESVSVILKTHFDNFFKGKYMDNRMHDLLGNGIFNADGEIWRIQRKTAANIFNTRSFRLFVETVFEDEMKDLTSRLNKAVSNSTVVDMHDLFFRFTLDSFAQIAFGIRLETMQKDNVPFALAFDRAQGVIDYRFISPFYWLEEKLNPFKHSKIQHDFGVTRSFAASIVEKRFAEPAEIRESRSDLLSLFMNARGKDGNPFSTEELVDQVLNFIIAGRDTTAQALSWCIYYLNKYPESAKKLVHEIDETLGDASYPTYDQVRHMRYANAVFHEALRLSPSVPKEIKTCIRDTEFPDGTIVHKGALVVWLPYAMARNPNVWGPDAKKFVPERWLDTSRPAPSQFQYPVFNGGPRVCLGKSLAELEGVFVLVSLLHHFDIKIVDLASVHYGNSLTMPMRNGMKCFISTRRR